MKKDLISIYNLSLDEIECVFSNAFEMKKREKRGLAYHSLKGKALAMIFEKPSTRTRVSFEVGMLQLGGHALFLGFNDTQMGRGESTPDTAKTLSRYVDGIMIRAFSQRTIEELAENATVPVINGLSDLLHPCQVLSDVFTLIEKKGSYKDIKVAYVGDGNNVANSWIHAALKLGFDLAIACPEDYGPDRDIIEIAKREATANIEVTDDPFRAANNSDVIYTDVWTSMGKDREREKRVKIFENYQVNSELLSAAKPDAIVMHCLPAHRGEEITDEVMDGPSSIVFDQAENRLHVQKAILEMLMSSS
ncbi:MAG: ornithine carbamoyltransferase [Pseudomonadota bacterium]